MFLAPVLAIRKLRRAALVLVGMSLLFVLLAWHLGYVFRIWTIWFAVTILLGSVHLGWHYLVDGLLAFAMVPPLWWIAGKLTGSSLARTSAHQRALEA